MTTATASNGRAHLALGEIFSFAYDTFLSNKVRFALTALGMVIGTASLILVTTIGLTGKQYVLNQIQAIGANLVYAEYESGGERITSTINDSLTIDDMLAVQRDVSGIAAASPVVPLIERIPVGNGKERDLQILGVYPEYLQVRNLVVLAGRFFDKQDSQAHNKVGIVTQKLAEQLYGSQKEALGKTVKLNGLPFTIVGIFRERVDTFGQSEVSDNTMLIPYSVIRYFQDTPTVKQIYFSTTDASMVVPVTAQIQRVIQARHRPESVYKVENLTQLVAVADKTANALTMVLLAVALIVLLVSGIGIMNIMLATVSQRIREIGIRKAIGATNREIRFQFLSEAVLISLIGGLIGIFIGLAIPFSVRFFTEYRIPISGLSAIIAIVVSSLVGIIFGTIPASRAAQLDPVESLRYE
ncbi:MAG: ABC transporter permease [Acidobacteria bacterium]|jgi:putative ABC transport system permease protein|nr:MAG: ABC transporter permease [Acidobacteriota bacterium]